MWSAILTEVDCREIARRHLDSAEAWLRRLIDHQLSAAFGANYWDAKTTAGAPVISQRLRKAVAERRRAEPNRYTRNIDATQFDEAIKVVLHPELYGGHFRLALALAYPDGEAEARTFLSRLNDHRNRIAHGRTCSQRDLEQCVCYSNDLADSLKAFFRNQNMARTFNVPTFTRVVDNRGNEFHLSPTPDGQGQFIDVRARGKGELYPGDELVIEAEVDQSFSGYTVQWMTFNGDRGTGPIARLTIEPKHVGVQMDVRFEVVSAEQWHKLLGCDDRLDLRYRVLPPVR
jgi:hypothetical protein